MQGCVFVFTYDKEINYCMYTMCTCTKRSLCVFRCKGLISVLNLTRVCNFSMQANMYSVDRELIFDGQMLV